VRDSCARIWCVSFPHPEFVIHRPCLLDVNSIEGRHVVFEIPLSTVMSSSNILNTELRNHALGGINMHLSS
jgi:hypothetical protein